MAKSRSLLERLLQAPDLLRAIPRLHPTVLHRVIDACGLEDCAEVIALATPAQIARVLDADVWRAPRPGFDEELDAERFGMWIDVLMYSDAAAAVRKLPELDLQLVIAGLARHIAVFDAAAGTYTTLDGERISPARSTKGMHACDVGGYLVEARRTEAWDAIVELLQALDAEHPAYFHRVMRGCRRLSSGRREQDASHDLLEDDEQEMFDLACARESRREREGYVPPAQARAFLQTARHIDISGNPPPASPLVTAYFRALDPEPAPDGEIGHDSAVADILRDEGVLPQQPRTLLSAGSGSPPERLGAIQAFAQQHGLSVDQLVYLANTLMAGASLQSRPFTRQEASDAAIAVCNLGLENWPPSWPERDLIGAFQIGLAVLHRDVCVFAAEQLAATLADLHCGDRDIQVGLSQLRFELAKQVREGVPWRAAKALDVIVQLDAPSWAALVRLIDEFPVMHGAIAAAVGAEQSKIRTIDPTAFEFVSDNRQIASIRTFLGRLPSMLT